MFNSRGQVWSVSQTIYQASGRVSEVLEQASHRAAHLAAEQTDLRVRETLVQVAMWLSDEAGTLRSDESWREFVGDTSSPFDFRTHVQRAVDVARALLDD